MIWRFISALFCTVGAVFAFVADGYCRDIAPPATRATVVMSGIILLICGVLIACWNNHDDPP